ncbi:DUF3105 domain-containing protein [Rubrobacter indicoceani]|uniref:DUF3105 domain-containing protein n=1 Tax=Rubrobacter indicoceani TaxID=2051957 RepID=UPI0013C44DB2|nr:DUF3105 domain-containing protein [Rubrobacter indicoceani]
MPENVRFKKPYPRTFALGATFIVTALLVSCGAESGGGDQPQPEDNGSNSPETTAITEETTGALSGAEVGEEEEANMLPARGIKKEDSRPLPENPPEGTEVYPASTNRLVDGEIDYERSPATNGDHNPFWQNCGFYDEPVMEEKAVHSLDHGVVWITYRPDLAQPEIDALRDTYGTEPYVIVSPYEEQNSPVVATAWRVQLGDLDSATDPRLTQFVDDFRVSELAPLSGNGCVGGSGEPTVAGPEDYYREG